MKITLSVSQPDASCLLVHLNDGKALIILKMENNSVKYFIMTFLASNWLTEKPVTLFLQVATNLCKSDSALIQLEETNTAEALFSLLLSYKKPNP